MLRKGRNIRIGIKAPPTFHQVHVEEYPVAHNVLHLILECKYYVSSGIKDISSVLVLIIEIL